MTPTLREAAQRALEAFDKFGDADDYPTALALTKTMGALRAALANEPQAKQGHDINDEAAMARMFEIGAKAWAGVDPQSLRDGDHVPGAGEMVSAADRMAAKAWSVVSRWQSPNWVSAEGRKHTGDLIEELADAARDYEADKGRAALAAAQPAVPQLSAEDVQWIVNDIAELGVMINGQAFFLYKGHSLVYEDATHDETGEPMHYRPVFKREFGECAHPINYADPTRIGTVSLNDSDEWRVLPPTATQAQDKGDSNE
jgi:hypothetical protein